MYIGQSQTQIRLTLDCEPTHTLVPCWMPKTLSPRNECTGCFAPAVKILVILNPTDYMLTSSGFAVFNCGIFNRFL